MPRSRLLSAVLLLAPLLVAADLSAQVRNGIKIGPWSSRRYCPDGWLIYESRNYQIQSQAGQEKAERLASHLEAMLRVYKKLFRSDKGSFKRYTVKLFKNREEFLAYGAPPGAGAYYSASDREMVCYDTGKWMDQPEGPITGGAEASSYEEMKRRFGMDILGASAHEGWHQYFHWYITSWVEIPSWINEGMGDYFYCWRPKEKAGRRELAAKLDGLNAMRLPVVYFAIKKGKHVPIKELLQYSQRQYYSNPSVCYAEGWALCHFLLESGNKHYAAVIKRFIHYVRDDTNMPKVTDKAFRGIDLDKLEEEWEAWVLREGAKSLGIKPKSEPKSAQKEG